MATGAVPLPAKGTLCVVGPLPPVMVKGTLIWAVRSPPAEGVKDTVIVQVPVPANSVCPEHVLPVIGRKSEAFVPVIVMVPMLVSTLPMFETVTVLNPASAAATVYFPVGSEGAAYSPTLSVVTVRARPEQVLNAVEALGLAPSSGNRNVS